MTVVRTEAAHQSAHQLMRFMMPRQPGRDLELGYAAAHPLGQVLGTSWVPGANLQVGLVNTWSHTNILNIVTRV
ncbi:hypothetical protein, partial [Mycobacterium riyadhense]|uniref:hypothetical protein n=1 Tax=Mycobacterium riyadhense TaxID=486698 RepID=UPI001B806E11